MAIGTALAATPPARLNYQGVLRNSSDQPLSGNYDMVFRFYSAPVAGDEILIDRHTLAAGGQVTVSGGLFNAQLGGGSLADGVGTGTYATLAEVFRDYGAVWLAIEVGGEDLTPRAEVVSAGYALNASFIEGKPASALLDTSSTGQAKSGKLIAGATSGTPSLYGLEAYGVDGGGYFKDSDDTGYARLGSSNYGVLGYGTAKGGYFADLDGTSEASLGSDTLGISAVGTGAGGYFADSNSTGSAWIGFGDVGIDASGSGIAGEFTSAGYSGHASVAYYDYGIWAEGNYTGGYFHDLNGSGQGYAGIGDYGLQGYGNTAGGYFAATGWSGIAEVAYFNYGISAEGSLAGGYFKDPGASGEGYAGIADYGIEGYGNGAGGYFGDSNSSGIAYVGYLDRGIWGKGTFAGGTFSHPDNTTFWADVATPTRKIQGTGTVSFVQNHPDDPDKVVVYSAPEGDEVAVYTRGTGRLVDGVARVQLGATFALVANPDLGLTAHVTPIGEPVPLAVEEKGPDTILVRGPAGSNTAFDYLVYGLRIGFEQNPVVQKKERQAFLPDQSAWEALGAADPELARTAALPRFAAMRAATGAGAPPDQARARDLEARINAGRDEVLAAAAVEQQAVRDGIRPAPPVSSVEQAGPAAAAATGVSRASAPVNGHSADAPPVPRAAPAPVYGAESPRTWMPVSEPVEAGDLLSVDPTYAGRLRRARGPADSILAGIATSASEERDGDLQAPLSDSLYARLKVDAVGGAIAPGDLLVVSPLAGHAMRAPDAQAGAVIARALEPLTYGQGIIRVLILPR